MIERRMLALRFRRLMRGIWAAPVVVMALALGGCSAVSVEAPSADPAPSSTAVTAESASPSESPSRPESEFSIPEDFPTEIPIRAGEIVVGTSAGEPDARTWVVEVLIEDLEAARIEELANLAVAGFNLVEESGIGTDTYNATLVGQRYTISLKVYLEPETGEKEILYLVNTN